MQSITENLPKKPKRKYTRKIKPQTSPLPSSLQPPPPSPSPKKSPVKQPRMNEEYAKIMGELLAIMVKKGDNIRARVYRRAQESILSIQEDIHSPQDLAGKPGIGPTIIEKLQTYKETGTLPILEREKENPENILSDVYGVGPKKAKELVAKGITSIAQLRERQDEVLNDVQKIGLKYYEDIMEKIPRKEIDQYAEIFESAAKKIRAKTEMQYEIVGSYRRGVTSSGDIDVIITSTDATAFNQWIDELLTKKIIIEVLSRGKTKCLVITRLTASSAARRVDFLYTTPAEYPFAVLYFTGSKGFNATMRGYALKKGVSLNEHGLSKMVDKKKEEKLSLNIADERGIFDYLGLVYKKPEERVDGRAIVPKDGKDIVEPVIENDEELVKEPPMVEKIAEEKHEKTLPKSLEKEKDGSPKKGKNTRKKMDKTKVPKVPKVPKELEAFCMDLLQKKGEQNPETPPEKKEDIEFPKSILKKESFEKLPKGPVLKKTMKKKSVKIAKSPTVITPILVPSSDVLTEPEPALPPIEILPGSPKLNGVIELHEPETPKCSDTKIESISKKSRKNKTKKVPKLPKDSGIVEIKPLQKPIEKINFDELESPKEPPKEPPTEKSKKNKTKKVPKVLGEPEKKESKKSKKTAKNLEPEKDIEPNIQSITTMPKHDKDPAISNIQEFKKRGISVLETLSQTELANLLVVANANYYNEKGGLMTDNEYDIVKEYMEKKYPTNAVIQQIGAPIERTKNKVTLPYEMWSMDKIKPDSNALPGWMKKYQGPYVLSCKLDGVSGLYSTEGGEPKLYTRGDGKVGQDISFLLPALKLPKEKGIVVRGEFIIPRKVFEEKYAKQFANPRNLVSGIVNSKKTDEKIEDLHFVTYEVIVPQLKPSEQLQKLKTAGFEVVQNETRATLSNESLSEVLVDWRTNYQYEIDGVIVTNDAIYPRISGNPEHAFAFKMMLSDQKAEVKVVDVLWTPSKDGFLKPRVRIEPVRLGGVTIEYATGYNGKFIEDNKIGIGAVIQIIRSGDVIPKILSVTTPAETAKMPSEAYKWNETHVDVLLENAGENATVQEKNLTAFFSALEIDGLKAGNVKKLKDAGYDTIPKILAMTKEDFAKVGYKTLAEKYVANIRQKVEEASVVDMMVASGTMGRGLGAKKLEPILEAYPDILVSKEDQSTKVAKVKGVKGIESKTATLFVENIPKFVEFLESIGQSKKLEGSPISAREMPAADIDTSNPLYGKKIVMSKVRDQDIIAGLKTRGATLENTIGSKTFVLIVGSAEDVSTKTKYAKDHGIPIMTPEEFKGKYLV